MRDARETAERILRDSGIEGYVVQGVDEESGLPHLWHMACNIAFLIEMYGEVEQRE